MVPSPKTQETTDLGVSLLLKAKVVGGQLAPCPHDKAVLLAGPCGLFRQAGGSRPAPESTSRRALSVSQAGGPVAQPCY